MMQELEGLVARGEPCVVWKGGPAHIGNSGSQPVVHDPFGEVEQPNHRVTCAHRKTQIFTLRVITVAKL